MGKAKAKQKTADVFFELKVFQIFFQQIFGTLCRKAKRIDCTGELEKQTPIYKHASISFCFFFFGSIFDSR